MLPLRHHGPKMAIQKLLNLNLEHSEMSNIVLALKAFGPTWLGKYILVRCDNNVVVEVLITRDHLSGCVQGMHGRQQFNMMAYGYGDILGNTIRSLAICFIVKTLMHVITN